MPTDVGTAADALLAAIGQDDNVTVPNIAGQGGFLDYDADGIPDVCDKCRFTRSDTNVEDLPGFTGAGLNRTLPNLVALAAQLRGVPEVWASPFLPRAVRWRSRALANPDVSVTRDGVSRDYRAVPVSEQERERLACLHVAQVIDV